MQPYRSARGKRKVNSPPHLGFIADAVVDDLAHQVMLFAQQFHELSYTLDKGPGTLHWGSLQE
jgi:hypothetical protein